MVPNHQPEDITQIWTQKMAYGARKKHVGANLWRSSSEGYTNHQIIPFMGNLVTPWKRDPNQILLVVEPPLWNIWVSWDDEIPNIWTKKHVPNHQPEIYYASEGSWWRSECILSLHPKGWLHVSMVKFLHFHITYLISWSLESNFHQAFAQFFAQLGFNLQIFTVDSPPAIMINQWSKTILSGLAENLQETTPSLMVKNHGFRLGFSQENQSIDITRVDSFHHVIIHLSHSKDPVFPSHEILVGFSRFPNPMGYHNLP